MAEPLKTSAKVFFQQVVSGAVPRSIIGAGGAFVTTRIHLKASANTVFVGHNADVTASSGVPLPVGDAAPYLDLWCDDPANIFVVGTGTVYVILEEPIQM